MKLNIEFDLTEDLERMNPIFPEQPSPKFTKTKVTISAEGITYSVREYDNSWDATCQSKYEIQRVINDIENYLKENVDTIRGRIPKDSDGDGVSADGWRNY